MRPNIAQQVDAQMMLLMGISVFFLLIITVAMIYFVFKYNRKKNPKVENISGNTTLEIIWTVIPTILVLVIFFYGWKGFENMRDIPEDSFVVKVTGQMWKWTFEYDNGKKSDTLYVPLNKPIRMNIYSIDVNHSFYVPAFRVKEDAIPGRENRLWFEGTELGSYYIACAEYCGLDHSDMYTKLVVMPAMEFDTWFNTPDVVASDTVAVDSTANTENQLPPGDTTGTEMKTITGDSTEPKSDTVTNSADTLTK